MNLVPLAELRNRLQLDELGLIPGEIREMLEGLEWSAHLRTLVEDLNRLSDRHIRPGDKTLYTAAQVLRDMDEHLKRAPAWLTESWAKEKP